MRKGFVPFTLSALPLALSLVGALLLALCFSAEAQQPKKVPLVGYLDGASLSANSARIEAFRQGLRDLTIPPNVLVRRTR